MPAHPLLMIPGPIEISDAVFAATQVRPVSHVDPSFKASFGRSLALMRTVWGASDDHQPFVVAGGGTLAMESAVTNLVDPGHTVLVVNTGYFGDRMAEMLRRRGANVLQVGCPLGDTVSPDEVRRALADHQPHALFATHVDTSTGVRVDVEALARLAHDAGVLSIFDGVCATAAETFEQSAWHADVYLTASQKAIGLPPGLALWMASPRALTARDNLNHPPPMSLDWAAWKPVMSAYEAQTNAYFSTPPTSLIPALEVALEALVAEGMPQVFHRHEAAAVRMQRSFAAMGLSALSTAPARTLSALRWPEGAGPQALPAIKEAGAIVAGGLHPACKASYFRVGHMGDVTRHPAALRSTLQAIGTGLEAVGGAVDIQAALHAFDNG